ncbi:MAG TPA: 16S rRNA (cytosine(967)-C(5))-methyltransferase RsmB [Planctomycetaceae bacterium]|nr:16S rRNA (cytosine(967)-C(5))-methyltransferase RsmB [Planctomycetaceae bacterium]
MPSPSARELAFDLLADGPGDEFVARRLDAALHDSKLSPADRRFATELVYGIVRRQATLDALLRPLVKRPPKQVEPELWRLLRLGMYQLAFLPGVPARAAVHETVELAKRRGPSWGGFVNGVLRAATRNITDERTTEPGPRAIPLVNGEYRLLNEPAFADPATEPALYFADAFSFPRWLVQRWTPRFALEELIRLGFWFNGVPGTSLRVNSLKIGRDEYLPRLAAAGLSAIAGSLPNAVHLEGTVRVADLPGFGEGLCTVQDESAMQAALLLDPQPGEHILDLCAAPGGKTTHLAELMQNRGHVAAVDVSSDRLQLVDQAVRRLGLDCIATELCRNDLRNAPAGPFDAVLADVPCSNTGVLGKRAEARWRIQPRDLTELPAIQARIVEVGLSRLRPGGRFVYSTCSIEPEENRLLIDRILTSHPDLRLEREIAHRPGQPADGGYQALLRVVRN